ncbi:MAG: MBOAT family O-acyltransferase [Agathobacter sp.]
MVFSSLLFLFRFLPLVLLLYYIVPKKWRNFVLFIASLIFYAWGEPVYVVLILLSTVVDYAAGRCVDHFKGLGKPGSAKAAVAASAIINLSLLGFFKYADFLIDTVNRIFQTDISTLEIALPIGISFYTFQTMSYTIDVYRGDAKVQKNFITFGAYVALFPQLIAGPIVRYKTVAEQLDDRRESVDEFYEGVKRFMAGLGKKVLIANQVGALWAQISATHTSHLTTATAWLGALAFTLQIYFDFSGYSDMAIGLGHMFGFRFLENFDHPYESRSITEFWRRWHISLGTWFREYVYIPLGGNRKGKLFQMRNILIVWFLTGLWHGAAWNFVIWGLYFCVLLVAEKLFLGRFLEKLPGVLQHVYTMFFVIVSWVIFSWGDCVDGSGYLKTMFGLAGNGVFDQTSIYLLLSFALLLLIAVIGSTSLPVRLWKELSQKSSVAAFVFTGVGIFAVLVLSVAFLVNSSYNPFLYFRF